jgi:hypothetical protein
MREAYDRAATSLAEIDPAAAQKVRDLKGKFESHFNRNYHFSDGTTLYCATGEDAASAQKAHDAWITYHDASVKNPWAPQVDQDTASLASKWEHRDGEGLDHHGAGTGGKVPQRGGTIDGVTFEETSLKAQDVQDVTADIKNLQSAIKEKADLGMTDLNTLMSQRQMALQLIQQMLQGKQEAMRIAGTWK